MWSIPHKQRARRYVQAQPTFSKRCGLIFFAHNCRIDTEGRAPFVYVEHSTLCGDADRQNTAVRLPRVFLPFVVDNMRVLADEEVRAAFFVPLRQPVPGGSRQ